MGVSAMSLSRRLTVALLAVVGFLGTNCGGGGSAAEGGRPIAPGLGGAGSLALTLPHPSAARTSLSLPTFSYYLIDLLDSQQRPEFPSIRRDVVPGQSTVSTTLRGRPGGPQLVGTARPVPAGRWCVETTSGAGWARGEHGGRRLSLPAIERSAR